jgi:hypothetical protein
VVLDGNGGPPSPTHQLIEFNSDDVPVEYEQPYPIDEVVKIFVDSRLSS